MKSSSKTAGKAAPRRRPRGGQPWLKLFVWVLLAIFILTSVGVALVITTNSR